MLSKHTTTKLREITKSSLFYYILNTVSLNKDKYFYYKPIIFTLKIKKSSNFRIMVVDDEEDFTTTFKHILQNNGFIVEVFNNPFEALEKFRKSPEKTYDILLLDMMMPGMNGGELYDNIRRSNKTMPRICFVTGHQSFYNIIKQSYPEISEKCFIRKPVDSLELITTLKQELQKI